MRNFFAGLIVFLVIVLFIWLQINIFNVIPLFGVIANIGIVLVVALRNTLWAKDWNYSGYNVWTYFRCVTWKVYRNLYIFIFLNSVFSVEK